MSSNSTVPPHPAAPLLPQAILDASNPTTSTTPTPPPPVADPSTLSSRGQRACQPFSPYFARFINALRDVWSESNRDGYVLLTVAENKLNWAMWADRVALHRQLDADVGAYSDCNGRPTLRHQLARFMNRRYSTPAHPVAIQPDQLCLGNGVGPTLAMLAALLCEPGDGILIPSPMYAAFPNDLSLLAGAIPVPVRTEAAEYRLTVEAFEAARQKFDGLAAERQAAQPEINTQHFDKDGGVEKQTADGQHSATAPAHRPAGITTDDEDANSIRLYQHQLEQTHNPTNNRRIKAVLLTNPHNPLAIVYEREEVEAIMAWAAQHGLHVIVDEIYGNSIWNPMPLPQYSSATATQAAADIAPPTFYSALHYLSHPPATASTTTQPLPPPSHLHVLQGLSKDFGLSGYRVGWLVTGSEAVRRAWGNVGFFQSVSNDVQCLLESVLKDEEWVDEYLYRCCELLAGNYHTLVRLLDGTHETLAEQYAAGQDDPTFTIPHLPARAGMFAFLDLRQFLPPPPLPPTATDHPSSDTSSNGSGGGGAINVWEREQQLFDALVDEARVLLTPGHSQLASEPGWFRLCFGWVGEAGLVDGMKRMRRVLYKRRYGVSVGMAKQNEVAGDVGSEN